MWLSKDERRLLAGYYTLIGAIETEKVYRLCGLARLLRFRGHRCTVPEYGESEGSSDNSGDFEYGKREIPRYINDCKRIDKANSLLIARGLITCTPHQHEMNVVVISLSVNGYDLGRRYSHPLESSGLWYEQYRKHWLWLILASLAGAVGSQLIPWIWSLLSDA